MICVIKIIKDNHQREEMETINPSLMPGRSEVGKFGQSASGRPFICCIDSIIFNGVIEWE